MRRSSINAVAMLALVLAVSGCSSSASDVGGGGETPPPSGERIAPGISNMPDGSIRVVGTLEYRDLEGGFWAVTNPEAGEDGTAAVIVAIANGTEFARELKGLEGQAVVAEGTAAGGVSIRMAGPEIVLTSIRPVGEAE